ncbi:DUF4288 domain-containing protein [Marinilactibacillus sp. XAAS-LB27]|uniref:DUF4288 domain-containing protein n=1 Tax=unclassified Marinilactibacillus TaxID=2632303 RepID=UPI001CE3EACF|nr:MULTISPECIES: DUF4288 domain-containing protein [unclassified Marinilactibacillus]MEC6748344.1 DUF4288 domain-containing protein [Marinilactibacillus sp. XAAS-LB27]
MLVVRAVSLLMGSFNASDHSIRNDFEHRILLYQFDEILDPNVLKQMVYKENTEEPYQVESGEMVYWKVVRIVDVFEMVDKVTFEQGAEVYSRFFIEEGLTSEKIISKYFSDFDWEKTN